MQRQLPPLVLIHAGVVTKHSMHQKRMAGDYKTELKGQQTNGTFGRQADHKQHDVCPPGLSAGTTLPWETNWHKKINRKSAKLQARDAA